MKEDHDDAHILPECGEELISCSICGSQTYSLGTKLCNSCWELNARIERAPDLAEKILEQLGHVTASHQQDVWDFQEKFGQLLHDVPVKLTQRKLKERVECMLEELTEFASACGLTLIQTEVEDAACYEPAVWQYSTNQDLAEQADALVDLVYFALGTANMLGLPWQKLWNDVQRANMSKERGVGKRGHLVDCVKPDGWVPPKTLEILVAAGYKEEEDYRDDPEHVG